jgi:hypothetical protein
VTTQMLQGRILPWGRLGAVAILCTIPFGEAVAQRAGSLPSQKSDKRENLREACRKIVAGEWLSTLDEKVQAEGWLKAIDAKSERTTKELAEQKRKLEELKKKTRTGEFRPGESTERDIAAGMVMNLETDLAANEALRGPARARLAKAQSDEKAFQDKIAPVFVVRKIEPEKSANGARASKPGGYPWEVDWRSPCPRWRFQCPLPPEQATALRRMFEDQQGSHEACLRYASIGSASTPP